MPERFDEYALTYDEDLTKTLAVTGEGRAFFAEGRVEWLRRCVARTGVRTNRVMDFGCGDGFATPILARGLNATSTIGVDVSEKSLEVARAKHAPAGIGYARIGVWQPDGSVDLAYCNGVFHHIPVGERGAAIALVARALRPGGVFAFWENNPWNLATHYVMARCPFDAGTQMLTPGAARTLLSAGGFEILSTDFRFIFPRALRVFGRLEDFAYRLPLGAQYQILARRS